MLSLPTIRKLLRESFPEEQLDQLGIFCVAESDRTSWLKDQKSKLETIERCSVRLSETSAKTYLLLCLRCPDNRRRDDWFKLEFSNIDGTEGLWISDSSYRKSKEIDPFAVCDTARIGSFLEAVKARVDRDSLKDKKNQKLANFKKTGLTARLRELGKEHGFSFAIGQSTRDINLSIRVLGRKKGFHFAFPKTKLDAVIDQVPDLVKTLENLQKLSVTFRTNNKHWVVNQCDWIEPPTPRKDKPKKA